MEQKVISLVDYQRKELDSLRRFDFRTSAIENLTVVAYYFRPESELDEYFWRTEFAFLKTFSTQGVLPAVLVVNRVSRRVKSFCEKFGIVIQEDKSLMPGHSRTLALDLVQNLYTRFDSDYVLTIQDDGFPLRSGIDEFLGKNDYIGAPFVRHVMWYDWYPCRYCVGNGGFSLRSRRLCCSASEYYRRYFKRLPYWWFLVGDDVFYCKTLRFWFSSFRKMFKWATPEEASRFSIENNDYFLTPGCVPLGFHSASGFCRRQALLSIDAMRNPDGKGMWN